MTAAAPGPARGADGDPVFVPDRPSPDVPVLVAGLASHALLSGSSEFSFVRETRGGAIDWGGVYGQGVRLTGPWTARVQVGSASYGLPDSLVHLAAYRWKVESDHAMGPLNLRQQVVAAAEVPGIVRRFIVTNSGSGDREVRLAATVSPFLAPVLVEGLKPYTYRIETRDGTCSVSAAGFALGLECSPKALKIAVNGRPWGGDVEEGELATIEWESGITVPSGESREVRWAIWGGRERYVRDHPGIGTDLVAGADGIAPAQERAWGQWTSATPTMVLPDAPLLERAYRLARGALRSLYTRPEPTLTGLVAGYPWYAALWCRDLAWMLPAVVWMGDWGWAEASLRTVFQYQARASLPVLGAAAGELPMQLSPGPVFLYGTSDTSLYYPGLLEGLTNHTGLREILDAHYPHLLRIGEWGRAKTDRASGLITNGGEVQRMTAASESVGRIHLGIDAADTTIWDSTDRRDHAIDIQVLWGQAMASIATASAALGRRADAAHWQAAADQLRAAVRERYWWPEEGYLFDSLRRDGTPVRHLRPNALRAVSAGWLPPDRARSLVERVARDDLRAPWGIRTLSTMDPGYDPIAYHDGQVWTIATAWAADAALRVGDADRGVSFLTTIAERVVEEFGQANECYRGDRAEPFNSCFLLGFSVAPFLTTLFESLWGISPHMTDRTIEVRPRFPPSWSSARVEGVRVGDGTLDLAWAPGELTVHWTGSAPIVVTTDGGAVEVGHGEIRTARLAGPAQSS